MFKSDRRDIKQISDVFWELSYTDDQLDRLDEAMTRMSDVASRSFDIFLVALSIFLLTIGLAILFWNPMPILAGIIVLPVPLMFWIHYESGYAVLKSIHSGVMIDIVVKGLKKGLGRKDDKTEE